jgi:hypothetical protein
MINSLQQNSVQLLNQLYTDKGLVLTKAMLSIQNNYYPSIKEILQTLELYKDVDLVEEFINKNVDEIEKAKRSIRSKNESSQSPEFESLKEKALEPDFMGFFAEKDAFKKIKGVSMLSLEDVISKAISKITDSELKVSINSMEAQKIGIGMSTDLNITITSQ